MKKFFKVVPHSASKPLGSGENNRQSPNTAKLSTAPIERTEKVKENCGGREEKKRKIGLDNDIFDTDASMEDRDTVALPVEEIVISDDEIDK